MKWIINASFSLIVSQFEEDKNEDKACEMYERILKIDPGHEAAKEAHYNLRGLEQDAQELGVDIR